MPTRSSIRHLALGLCLALAAPAARAVDPVGTAQGVTALANLRLDSLVGGPLYVIDLWAHDHPDGHRYAYLTTEGFGMFVVDVTDPVAPFVVTQYFFPGWERDRVNAVKLRDTWAFVALDDGGVSILDVSVPASPVEVAHLSDPPFTSGTHTLWVDGNWLYAANLSLLAVVDVTDPRNPALRGTWAPPSRPFLVHDLTVFDGRAYVACVQAGMRVLDVSNPPSPVEICTSLYDSWMVTHSAWPNAARTHVLVTDEQCNPADGIIHVVDVRNLSTPTVASTIALSATLDPRLSMHQPFIANDVAYLAWYREGLRVYDFSNPAAPVEIARFATYDGGGDDYACYSGAYGVWADGCGLAYVADTGRGLWILKVDAVPQCAPHPVLLAESAGIASDSCRWPGSPNGDGVVSPGESVSFAPLLRNVGGAPATGVQLDVVAHSSGIAIAGGSSAMPDVAPGSSGQATTALVAFVSELADCGSEQWIDLRVGTDQGDVTRRVTMRVGQSSVVLADDFSTDRGWTTASTGTGTEGYWVRASMSGVRGMNPPVDDPRDSGDAAFVTGDVGGVDVDELSVDLVSPVLDLSAYQGAQLEWSEWLWRDSAWRSWLSHAELLKDGVLLAVVHGATDDALTWRRHSVPLPAAALASGVQVRFRAASLAEVSGFEAGIDHVVVTGWSCPPCSPAPLDVVLDVAVDACGTASDGVLQAGETLELRPLVTNRSSRTIDNPRVAITSMGGPWLDVVTEVALPPLAPGASTRPSPGLLLRVVPSASCGSQLEAGVSGHTDDGYGAAARLVTTTGAVTLTRTVALADSFDAALEGFVPPGWTASTTDDPANLGTSVDASINPVGLSPGAATPPHAVRLGPTQYPDGQRHDYDLAMGFDPRPWLGAGDILRVSFDAWVHALDAGDRLALRVRDGAGSEIEAWFLADASATILEHAYEWQHVEVDVDAAALDLGTPLTFTFRASLDASETGSRVEYDAAYVDSFAISAIHRDVACAPCVVPTTDELFRLDVPALGPLDRTRFLVPPRRDGISLNVPAWAPITGPGGDPLDPAVLLNGVPLICYQVAKPDGSQTRVRITKSGPTVRIDY